MSSGNKHKNSYLEGHYDPWKRPHTTQTLTTTAQVPNGGRSKKTGQEESTKALKPSGLKDQSVIVIVFLYINTKRWKMVF